MTAQTATTVTNEIAEIIWTAEQEATGVFSAGVGRKQAQELVKEGYSFDPAQTPADEHEVFGVLAAVEDEVTGFFRAQVARSISRTLVKCGLTVQR